MKNIFDFFKRKKLRKKIEQEILDENITGLKHILMLQATNINYRFSFEGSPMTPLILAVHLQNPALIGLLIQHGADVNNIESNKYSFTALQFACYQGSLNIVKMLLENEAKANLFNKQTPAPLAIACAQNNPELVKLLLAWGANVEVLWEIAWHRFSFQILDVLVKSDEDLPADVLSLWSSEK